MADFYPTVGPHPHLFLSLEEIYPLHRLTINGIWRTIFLPWQCIYLGQKNTYATDTLFFFCLSLSLSYCFLLLLLSLVGGNIAIILIFFFCYKFSLLDSFEVSCERNCNYCLLSHLSSQNLPNNENCFF